MDAPTPTRTPLHAMSDEQLLFYATDDTASPWKRDTAVELLDERNQKAWLSWGQEGHSQSQRVPLVERISSFGRKA